ncbi:MAG: CoA transferase [Actinomycetota bacterium]|nr:CoA transferase [Actinomycetota bacterium]MDH5277708.1 CoA transferase [Actinomycetota bacterium]
MAGPLHGVRVVEFAALGPAPFTGMLLADLGADVVRVDRPGTGEVSNDTTGRGKRSVAIDLKSEAGRATALRLVEHAHIVLEGFRPGVMERLGLGPDVCHERNPALVYGRMTGWGQEGPLAQRAGHDLDFLAVTGVLWAMGRPDEPPAPPLNLVGDLGGGAMFLAVGVLAALLAARETGQGDVVDAAIVDGTTALATMLLGLRSRGLWTDERGHNLLDSGAPFYDVYACADGRYLAVGALEPRFYAELVAGTGFDGAAADQYDAEDWPRLRQRWAEHFRTRPRDEWVAMLDGVDACVAPVLDWVEAAEHPHLRERGVYIDVGGEQQPAPAPRFTVRATGQPRPAPAPGQPSADVDGVLGEWA